MRLSSVVAAALATASLSAAAHADRAPIGVAAAADPDPYDKLRRPDGTLPVQYDNLDRMHAQMVVLETYTTVAHGEARTALTAVGARFALPLSRDHRDHDDVVSLMMETLRWDKLDLGAAKGTAEYGQALGMGLRVDRGYWGIMLGGHILGMSEDEHVHFATPWVGARLGRSDRAVLALEAHFPGMFALSSSDERPTFSENHDLRLTATTPLTKAWHLQLRARHRDVTANRLQLRETFVALGVEGALEFNLRGLPVFAGIGVRHLDHHLEQQWDLERGSHLGAEEPAGTQLLLVLSVDVGFHGDNAIW